MNLAPMTAVLLVFAVTITFSTGTILAGLLPFILAAANELARMLLLRTPDPAAPERAEGRTRTNEAAWDEAEYGPELEDVL